MSNLKTTHLYSTGFVVTGIELPDVSTNVRPCVPSARTPTMLLSDKTRVFDSVTRQNSRSYQLLLVKVTWSWYRSNTQSLQRITSLSKRRGFFWTEAEHHAIQWRTKHLHL